MHELIISSRLTPWCNNPFNRSSPFFRGHFQHSRSFFLFFTKWKHGNKTTKTSPPWQTGRVQWSYRRTGVERKQIGLFAEKAASVQCTGVWRPLFILKARGAVAVWVGSRRHWGTGPGLVLSALPTRLKPWPNGQTRQEGAGEREQFSLSGYSFIQKLITGRARDCVITC